MDIRANSMDSRKKQLIDEARRAVLNQEAREEQKLIWELAEAIHSVRTSWMVDDEMAAKKILYENDYDAGVKSPRSNLENLIFYSKYKHSIAL